MTEQARNLLLLGLRLKPIKKSRLLKIFLHSQALGNAPTVDRFPDVGLGDQDLRSHFLYPFGEGVGREELVNDEPDRLDPIEASFLFSKKGMFRYGRPEERSDKQGDEDGFGNPFIHFDQLIHETEQG